VDVGVGVAGVEVGVGVGVAGVVVEVGVGVGVAVDPPTGTTAEFV